MRTYMMVQNAACTSRSLVSSPRSRRSPPARESGKLQDSESSMVITAYTPQTGKLVICVNNTGYEASLERRKLHATLNDAEAKKHRLIRVIDESGDDYLYPESYFLAVTLPPATRQAVLAAA